MIAMSRRPWTPETATPEQLRLREAAIEAFQRAGAAEAEGYAFAGRAHAAGVPMEDLAEKTGKSRATLFRNAKKPSTDEPATTPPEPRRRAPLVAPLEEDVSVDDLVSEPFEDPA